MSTETDVGTQAVAIQTGRYYCEVCDARFAEGLTECPRCEDEPLLDLEDPEVVAMIRAFDTRDAQKRSVVITFTSMALSVLWVIAAWDQFGGLLLLFQYLAIWAIVYDVLAGRFPARKRLPAPEE